MLNIFLGKNVFFTLPVPCSFSASIIIVNKGGGGGIFMSYVAIAAS